MDFMLSCSHQKHIHYNIIEQLMDTLELLVKKKYKAQYLVLCTKSLIGFDINIPNSKL